MKRIILFLFVICVSTLSQAQPDKRIKAINEQFRSGEQLLLEKKYRPALKAFQKVLKENPDHTASYRASGTCYELLGDYPSALSSYFNVLSRDPYFSRIVYYEIGRTYYRLGEYHSALDYFSQFAGLQNLGNENFGLGIEREQAKELEYLQELGESMLACQISVDSIQYLNVGAIVNLGDQINTEADEYFPYVSLGDELLFFTRRKNAKTDENLFISTAKDSIWGSGQAENGFNSRFNEGMTTLIRNGRKMYFTACERDEIMGMCDIWEAKVDGKRIQKMKTVDGYLNSEFWESQASVSCDGTTLYFASNRDGGMGGTDIWMSEKEPDGRWSEPTNMGPNINTARDEEAPFITTDGKTLYFSSTGHFGMGEGDIYFSKMQRNKRWTKARNLGAPVNSAARELGFFLSSNGKTGYFASNREGGEGGMDIYKFDLPNQLMATPITYVEGYVKGKMDNLPIRPATVRIQGRDPVEVDERGRFFICFPANETLSVEADATGYRTYYGDFEIPYWENKELYTIDLLMDFNMAAFTSNERPIDSLATGASNVSRPRKEEVILSRITTLSLYYDTNQKNLNLESKGRLENFLQLLDRENITRLEIIGFADYVGSDADNMKLSEDRARIVSEFIQKRNIAVNKFFLQAKGEVDDGQTVEQNRRVDIIVHTRMVKQ
jgi:outer membrane protein OmpA-like peptidoglycan-associated protein